MHKINNLLDNLEAQIANYSMLNQAVSKGNVGWHIVHSCLVINSVCAAVVKSDASKFIKKFKILSQQSSLSWSRLPLSSIHSTAMSPLLANLSPRVLAKLVPKLTFSRWPKLCKTVSWKRCMHLRSQTTPL